MRTLNSLAELSAESDTEHTPLVTFYSDNLIEREDAVRLVSLITDLPTAVLEQALDEVEVATVSLYGEGRKPYAVAIEVYNYEDKLEVLGFINNLDGEVVRDRVEAHGYRCVRFESEEKVYTSTVQIYYTPALT